MNDVTTLTRQLEEAEADLALYQRLTTSEERVKVLTRDLQIAKEAEAKAEEAEAKAAHEARFKGLSNIRVSAAQSPGQSGPLWMNFTITYTKVAHDPWSGMELPQVHTAHSFAELPRVVLDYLMEEHPEQIPSEIMALAPGDPYTAFATYFAGRRRGYLNGKPAV